VCGVTDPRIELSEFLGALRAELEKARAAGISAREQGSDVRFTVGEVTIEFTIAASREGQGQAGVKFYVFSLGGSVTASTETTQRVTLTLTPTRADGKPLEVSDDRTSDIPR
jgi:Trypsin-co-occurring domain 2